MSKYSKEYYQAHKAQFAAASKRYHEKNKDKIREKYAHHRKAWNEAHKAYVNEHARLAKEIRKANGVYDRVVPLNIKKDYLRELHAKGMV